MAKPTQKDIAKLAGVDRTVVSKVLSGRMGKTSVRDELKDDILAVAKKLGYKPNLAAQAVKTGKFNTVALITSTQSEYSYLPPRLLTGIHDKLAQHDIHLMVASFPDEKLEDARYIPNILRTLMVDGLIINYTYHVPPRLIELLEEYQLPVIWLNQERETDAVYPDNYSAALKLTEYLINKGHKKISFFDGGHTAEDLIKSHYSNIDRARGYHNAMKSAGLDIDEHRPLSEGKIDLNQNLNWFDTSDCTAIISQWVSWVPHIMLRAYSINKKVPEEIAIATFNVENRAEYGLNFMPSMVEPQYEMGAKGAEMLLEKIAAPEVDIPSIRLDFNFDKH